MMSRPLVLIFLGLCFTLAPARGLAVLVDRGGGLIYDTVSDVTWLQDASYAQTSGFHPTGHMTWHTAMSWAANLSYYDSVRDTTWTDWRLPTSLNPDGSGPCFGFDCPDSEQGNLYWNEGIRIFSFAPFVNFEQSYWSNTGRAPLLGSGWLFNFTLGKQDHTGPLEELVIAHAHAVRDGDVAMPPPMPSLGPVGLVLLTGLLVLSIRLSGRHH